MAYINKYVPAVVKSNDTSWVGSIFYLSQYSEKLNANIFAGDLNCVVGFSISASGVAPLVFENIFFIGSLTFKQLKTPKFNK